MNFKTTRWLYATLAFLLIPAFAFAQPPNDLCAGAIPATFINPQGTGCATPTVLAFTTDGTTDSGVPNVCSTPGNDQWFTWTATSPSLFFDSEDPGQPGMAVFANCADAAAGNDITCAVSHASATLSGWNVGDDLIIQIYDVTGQMSDVAFCLEEFTPPISCGGNFFDSGGPTTNYANNEDLTTTICPTSTGDVVTVTFTAFDVELNFDFLSVFDGNDNSAPSLGIFTGTNTPGPFTSTAASGCLTFVFNSDVSFTEAGWEANVTCAPPPSCPTVTSVATSNVTDASVDVSFTASNGQTLFEAQLFASGADPLTATPLFTMTGAASPISFAGLAPATTYDAYVRTDCSAAGAGVSDFGGPATFTTFPINNVCAGAIDYTTAFGPVPANGMCPGATVFLDIGPFSDNGVDPTCDFGTDATAWYTWTATSTSVEFISGTNLPGLEILDGSCGAFTSVGCLNNESGLISGLTIGTTYHFIIWDDDDLDVTIDWCLQEGPSCPDPTSLAVTSVTQTTADVTFNPIASGGHTVEFGPPGFMPGMGPSGPGTTVAVPTGGAVTLTGLMSLTTYDVYVTADCGSAAVGPVSFTTSPPPPACGGSFFDSGGPTADYSINELITTTICPDNPGDVVTVTFTAFDTESNFDFLSVFDGDTDQFPTLGTFSGTTVPGPFTSSAFSGCLTFVFDSDISITRAGWEANVTCAPLVPLPVELASFNAYPATVGNVVEWTAATEIDFYMYTVEKATDPTNFRGFADVAPKGTANAEAVYSTQDLNPSATTYYRLRMEDLDGSVEYSDVVAVTRDDISGGIKMFPNPAKEHVTFEVLAGVTDNGNINVVLTDLNGRQVRVWTLAAGERTNVSLSGIPSGVYMVSSVSVAGTASQRLVID